METGTTMQGENTYPDCKTDLYSKEYIEELHKGLEREMEASIDSGRSVDPQTTDLYLELSDMLWLLTNHKTAPDIEELSKQYLQKVEDVMTILNKNAKVLKS